MSDNTIIVINTELYSALQQLDELSNRIVHRQEQNQEQTNRLIQIVRNTNRSLIEALNEA